MQLVMEEAIFESFAACFPLNSPNLLISDAQGILIERSFQHKPRPNSSDFADWSIRNQQHPYSRLPFEGRVAYVLAETQAAFGKSAWLRVVFLRVALAQACADMGIQCAALTPGRELEVSSNAFAGR